MHSHSAVVAIGYYGEVCRWSMGTRKNETEYKTIVEKPGPKLNAFINNTRAAQALAPRESMKAKFPISIFQF